MSLRQQTETDRVARESLPQAFRSALRGTHADLTALPLSRAILLLAVPMVAEMVMESTFALVDVIVVARLGADAVATVGLTEGLLTVVYALAVGISIGVSAIVARRIGEKNESGAARSVVQAFIVSLAAALLVGGSGVLLADRLLAMMGGSPSVLALGGTYARLMLGSTVSITLLFTLNGAFRAAGDPAVAMRVLWLANGLNIVLSPCLTFGIGPIPRLGVTGAALATVIGRSIGVLYQLYVLARGQSRLVVERKHLALEGPTILSVLKLSGDATFQSVISMSSWIVAVRMLSAFGSAVVAGYTIALRLVLFGLLPAWGLGMAAATLVGQNLGAKKPEQAERAVMRATFYSVVFLGVLGVILIAFAEPIIGAIESEPTARQHGVSCLRIVGAGFPFYGVGMVMSQAINGAGDTRTPTILNFIAFWVIELPLAYVLAHPLHLGGRGVYIGILVGFVASALLDYVWFKLGRWKTKQL